MAEGPTCQIKVVQGLLKENATAAPWISNPTAADARVRGGPRRAPGARVHGGPATLPEGVRDPVRPREIQRSRSCARRRDSDSPALSLDRAPGHQFVHGLVHYIAGTHAHVTGGVQGVDRALLAAGTGRGRRGRSDELVSAPRCTRRREF
jgi:hypothetical protein